MRFALTLLCLTATLGAQETETSLRRQLQTKTGTVTLPAGTVEVSRELILPADAHDLTVRGAGLTIKAAAAFRGRALIVLPAGKNIRIEDLTLDGNRAAFPQAIAPTPAGTMISREVANNGIFADGVVGLTLSKLKVRQVAGFSILVDGGRDVHVRDVEIADGGSLDAAGHNNGSGGILLEEGVTDFEVLHSLIGKVRGNGVWVRSAEGSASAARGRIADNQFAILARAAIELNRVSTVTVENNTAQMIGFPGDETVTGGTALPAGIATSGSVDHAILRNNTFEQLAGRCMSLDGFGNGEVTGNTCSEGLFNGMLIRGAGNKVTGNRMTGLNQARRETPESLRAGIYLAGGSTGNTIEANQISGYGMAKYCVGGPALAANVLAANAVAANAVARNACSDGASVARLLPAKPR